MRIPRTVSPATAIATLALVISVAGVGGPAVARIVANADKVDGRHAVGAGAGVQQRAGKLVATGTNGYLPDNIIVKAAKAVQADHATTAGTATTANSATTSENSELLAGKGPEQYMNSLSLRLAAWLVADADGTPRSSSDSVRVEPLSTGVYRVPIQGVVFELPSWPVTVTAENGFARVEPDGTGELVVRTFDIEGNPADRAFTLFAYAALGVAD